MRLENHELDGLERTSTRHRSEVIYGTPFPHNAHMSVKHLREKKPVPSAADNSIGMPTGVEQHYRARGLAERLGVSSSFAKRLLASRQIETIRLGKAVLVSESAVKAYLERNRIASRPA